MRNGQTQLKTIAFGDALYPKEWQNLPDAPQTLQYLGDATLLQTRKFTVVGSRRTPTAALKTGADVVGGIAKCMTIVTGAADGGDSAAIEGALKNGGKVICVLAGGFSAIPQGNLTLLEKVAECGLLLSPHTYETTVRSFSYAYRNKLIAALGEGTLVLGAAEQSGALITAKYAVEQGKKVFALPYAPGVTAGMGCNALIKQGAYLTETAADVLDRFGLEAQTQKTAVSLSEDEQKMLNALRELSRGHVMVLAEKAGIPAFKARAVLSSLEVKGQCVAVGGNQYSPV